jgi:hypothetical protein
LQAAQIETMFAERTTYLLQSQFYLSHPLTRLYNIMIPDVASRRGTPHADPNTNATFGPARARNKTQIPATKGACNVRAKPKAFPFALSKLGHLLAGEHLWQTSTLFHAGSLFAPWALTVDDHEPGASVRSAAKLS